MENYGDGGVPGPRGVYSPFQHIGDMPSDIYEPCAPGPNRFYVDTVVVDSPPNFTFDCSRVSNLTAVVGTSKCTFERGDDAHSMLITYENESGALPIPTMFRNVWGFIITTEKHPQVASVAEHEWWQVKIVHGGERKTTVKIWSVPKKWIDYQIYKFEKWVIDCSWELILDYS
jgi:hypothetical protein